jgi:hypothetical protein
VQVPGAQDLWTRRAPEPLRSHGERQRIVQRHGRMHHASQWRHAIRDPSQQLAERAFVGHINALGEHLAAGGSKFVDRSRRLGSSRAGAAHQY